MGAIKDNSVIPSIPIVLVYMTLIIRPNILVMNPPTNRIKVDFINLFFVLVSPL